VLAFSPISLREQTLVAWARLCGAAPIILATFSLVARIEKADMIFHLVFFTAFTSVVMQEKPIPLLTRVLKIKASPSKNAKSRLPLDPWETDKPMG
jgi:cell volume regulation protein A